MTIGDLIKNKDYNYVSYRLTLPDGMIHLLDALHIEILF